MPQPFRFEDLTLVVPNLWEKDWTAAVADAEDRERSVVEALARYSALLRNLPASPATPAKVGWLSLWSRMFGCLTGVRGAVAWESRFPIEVLERVAFETGLHVRAVLAPMLRSAESESIREDVRAQVRDRLTAYVAWALRGDEMICDHVGRSDRLDASFDPAAERELIADLGDKQEWWRQLSGQSLELVSDEEAALDKSKARNALRARRDGIKDLLSDPRVLIWVRRLKELERAASGSVPLLALLGEGSSVGSFAKRDDPVLGYSAYFIGSHAIHGSSLRASLLVAPPILMPDFASLGGNAAELARGVANSCSLHAVLLGVVSSWL